ncbi:helix-turn-helix domain-containing protein [Amycolatopsis sp. cg9]|uniref:helix-turn-helix domain-containing protein n=1 Tax=Amycolatopsis sp. cg9 TaxID=3238801 RepID=UPI0035249760
MLPAELPGESVGERLKAARKFAGVTQAQLARATSFSVSLIKKVEQGQVPPSAAFVAEAGRALAVKAATLYGMQQIVDEPSPEAAGVAELRSALDAYDDPRPEGPALDLAAVTARLGTDSEKVLKLRHDEVAGRLAGLLHHLYVLSDQPGRPGELVNATLHDAYRMAATVAGRFRQPELAAIASERHVQLAERTGDPRRIAISSYHRSTRYLQHGEYRAGLRLLDRAREHLDATAAGRAVQIQLDLRASILAARAGDGAEADGYLEEARAIAREFEPPEVPYYGVDASSTNILAHWCAAPVERYDGAEAVRRAAKVNVDDPRRPERVGHHHMDMGRAWMLHGDRAKAVSELNVARRAAPNAVRHHPSFRETLLGLAAADRRATGSLAGLAKWSGVKL